MRAPDSNAVFQSEDRRKKHLGVPEASAYALVQLGHGVEHDDQHANQNQADQGHVKPSSRQRAGTENNDL